MKQKWVKHPLLLTAALLLCCFITTWLGMHGFYISLLVAGCVTLFVAYTIYRYILRSARAMAQLIWAIRYSDFLSLPAQREEHLHSLPAELWDELNEAAKRLLGKSTLKSVEDLADFQPELPSRLYSLKAGDLSVLQVQKKEERIQLALSGMEFVIQGRPLIVASMKNIHSVLDNQETEAWQKLIRVLTHEIMNSITPVTSLSELLEQQIGNFDGDAEERKEILQMLQTIRRRGDGLIRFVNSYREVSHLPQPLLKIYTDRELLAGIAQLMHTDRDDLHLVLPDKPLRLIIDKDLIEQVLINLIRNARENDATDIRLSTGLSSGERPYIRIEDNGTGIEQEVLERIFVPFFTTKTTGSGIGLTISRQIMHLHHGTITASSETGKGSTFTLLFPPLF